MADPFRVAFVLPVYNHGGSVGRVLDDLRAAFPDVPVVAVDDGSTDTTAAVLAGRSAAEMQVIRMPVNRGKGRALCAGFARARELGATHALTLDADGQHDVADIPVLLATAREHPDDLVIGQRDMSGPNVPRNSIRGRNLARFWLQVQTGQDIPDSQCGLRVYPLEHAAKIRCLFGRFDFETEILARLAWGGLTIRNIPIRCIYFPPEQRVSHFRPLRDTLRGVRVNAYLVARRLAPVPFRRCVPRPKVHVAFGKWWAWSTWREAFRRVMRAGSSNAQLAAALATGVFIGLTPTFPIQTLLAIYLARRLHLNVLAAVLGSQISIPPLLPLWWFLWLETGSLLVHGRWFDWDPRQFHGFGWSDFAHVAGVAVVGSIAVAIVGGILTLLVSRAVLQLARREDAPEQSNR